MENRPNSQQPICETLPPQVVDKYLFADYYGELFQFRTGQAICQSCPVQLECLTEAITAPDQPIWGIRGGESPNSIRKLHVQLNQSEATAEEIATAAIAKARRRPGVERLRHGNFEPNMPLALPARVGRRTA